MEGETGAKGSSVAETKVERPGERVRGGEREGGALRGERGGEAAFESRSA